jgi:hypothetical protein
MFFLQMISETDEVFSSPSCEMHLPTLDVAVAVSAKKRNFRK